MTDEESYEFPHVDAFVPGVEGTPGNRTFYLQVRLGPYLVTFRCEKQHVEMLGQSLVHLVEEGPGNHSPDRDPVGAIEPFEPVWSVGEISVEYSADGEGPVTVVVHAAPELSDIPVDVDITEDTIAELVQELAEAPARTARISLTRAQALAFGERAAETVAGGRPVCRLCGMSIDGDVHTCPRWN